MPDSGLILDAPAMPGSILPVRLDGIGYAVGGKALLDGLDLQIAGGRRTVILGPNGAGKSLTLRLLQGLIAPTAGRLTWAGRPGNGQARRKVALVFQRPVLLRRSVAANLAHALAVYGVPAGERGGRIESLLAMAGLDALRDRPARVLSGGEQQRLSVVRALAAEPELLLLDEPTASLDPYSTDAIERLVIQASARGCTVVLVTHDLGQARRLAEDVAFLHRGRLIEQAPASRFFAAPASAAGQAFVDGQLLI